MEAAGLAIGVVAAADLCIKFVSLTKKDLVSV
jgi:hypothetical protein